MITFAHIEYLFLLSLIPVLILFIFLYLKWKREVSLKFNTTNLENKLHYNRSKRRVKWKYTLQILAIIFLILGLSNPKIGTNLELVEVNREGIEMIIALDVSNSMLCEDIEPNRLSIAKEFIYTLIDHLKGDRIGLVIFAGKSYTEMPITSDYSAVKVYLNNINTNTIKTQGTNLSSAIQESVKSFNFKNEFNKSIIIITDGEDHEEGALKETQLIAEKGVLIHTLSIGDSKGGPIPCETCDSSLHKTDKQGNIIVTKPNFNFLSELANIGNGMHLNINNPEIKIQELLKEINKIKKKKISSEMKFINFPERFQWFLFISLLLFLLDLSILNIKNKIMERWIKK